ncbi:MAG: glycosyltransferase family 39 protein [Candidatus Niyogibacteria bacterium]|nr:glycosyltransferase family 39 protein [Candidatus Niyogibacteria bacterium]
MFFSALDESAIMDELAHIPAAYSYVSQSDFRLNPEHPPLLKDLTGIPLLFLNLNFPLDVPAWITDVNGQWTMGSLFLYESGNDPDQILFWARIPVMLLALLFGWLMFQWVRRLYGEKVALFSLFFFTTSPTIIAHSRYVTTDVAAAFAFFIGIAGFLYWLAHPSKKTFLLAGIVFGIAQLLKFSLILLIPLYGIIGALWIFLFHLEHLRALPSFGKKCAHLLVHELKFLGNLLIIGVIGLIVIYTVYAFHVWNYPADLQIRDMKYNLESVRFRPVADALIALSDIALLRPLTQYAHGLMMVINRGTHGNTTYFLGEVTNNGWFSYFPIAYLLKEHLAFHLLTLFAFFLFLRAILQAHEKSLGSLLEWMRDNFALTASVIFIVIYWTSSILSPLNIGVRHVLPTFPFIYLIVSREIVRWVHQTPFTDPQTFKEWFVSLYHIFIKRIPRYLIIFVLLLWMAGATLFIFPHYLSYYNELAGGAPNGYKFITDSNYDWGQDLRRLADFVEKNNIQNIKLNYFGGGSPRYYLGGAYEEWSSAKGEPPTGWFALSATLRQGAWGTPVREWKIKPEDSYDWLRDEEPVARAGYSIFIYNLDEQ